MSGPTWRTPRIKPAWFIAQTRWDPCGSVYIPAFPLCRTTCLFALTPHAPSPAGRGVAASAGVRAASAGARPLSAPDVQSVIRRGGLIIPVQTFPKPPEQFGGGRPRRGRGSRLAIKKGMGCPIPRSTDKSGLPEEREDYLGHLVTLGNHRGAGLEQDLVLDEFRHLLGHVGVAD